MMFRANAALAVAVSLFCGPQRDAAVSSPTDSSVAPRASIAPRVSIAMQEIVSGLDQPVYLTAPAGDARLFIVEQAGRIMMVKNGTLSPRPFLDIRDKVGAGGERGLLSVAFHPLYRTNGFLFVHYTDKSGDSNIERYKVSRDPDA